MTAAKLIELEARATEGPCIATRNEPNSAAADFYEPYANWIYGGFPKGVTVGRGLCIHADDMALIAYLRNHAQDFIKLIEAAEKRTHHYECEDPWYSCPKSENGCADDRMGPECTCGADEMREALAAFKEKS